MRFSRVPILLAVLAQGAGAYAQTAEGVFPARLTLYKDTAGTYAQPSYGAPPTTPGPVIQFRGKFEDASYSDQQMSSGFLEDEAPRKTQRIYLWPANQDPSYDANTYSQGKVVSGHAQFGVYGEIAGERAKCFLSVRANPQSVPPKVFPSVQIHTADPRNRELKTEEFKSYRPKRYLHELWLTFKGGEFVCQVQDKEPTKTWKISEVTEAFGAALITIGQPGAALPATPAVESGAGESSQ